MEIMLGGFEEGKMSGDKCGGGCELVVDAVGVDVKAVGIKLGTDVDDKKAERGCICIALQKKVVLTSGTLGCCLPPRCEAT